MMVNSFVLALLTKVVIAWTYWIEFESLMLSFVLALFGESSESLLVKVLLVRWLSLYFTYELFDRCLLRGLFLLFELFY